jgi:hypothetical protein
MIDYKKLLNWYMSLVLLEEGVTFVEEPLSWLARASDKWKDLSAEEADALFAIRDEVLRN